MPVNIDTVYQRVLVAANKEQRGYITPQEFNLFANQAQMEIFEQYFYDLNQYARMPSVGIEYSDVDEKIDEKLSLFKTVEEIPGTNQSLGNLNSTGFALPDDLYKIGTIWEAENSIEIHKVDHRELTYIVNSPLGAPTAERPIYVLDDNQISIFPQMDDLEEIAFRYIRTPAIVAWGYTVVNEKPMLNPGNTIDFELHASEETELVYRILKLAGINLKATEVVQVAQNLESTQVQQEKQ